ncbi:MAG TPA: S41 family peptidase [bacterium]|nr:S41 family peptidase [bacterium]
MAREGGARARTSAGMKPGGQTGVRLRRAAFGLAVALALVLVSAAPPHAAAADASLVVAALRIAEREYFRALDPIALLNAAITSLRSRAALDGNALPDIPAGTAEEEAVRLFTAEFAQAETAASASEPEFVYAVTQAMLASVHDSHVRFMTPAQYAEFRDSLAGRSAYGGIGVRTTFPDGADGPFVAAVVPESPAAAAGVKVFDQILAADGVPFKGGSASEVVSRLRGPAGSTVLLRVRRRGATLDLPVTRAVIHTPAVEAQTIRPGVAYVRIWGFSRGAAVEARRALEVLRVTGAIRAVVLDLRGNPGGFVIEAEWIAGLFVPAGTVLAHTHTAAASGEFVASGDALLPSVPLALLTDRGSASGAEILAIGLRDANRAIIVGETTAGAFGGARDFPLPEGGILVTTRALTGPRDEAIEGRGIAPDRAVAITVDDLLRGDDVQLETALSLLGAAVAPHRPVRLRSAVGRALSLAPAA